MSATSVAPELLLEVGLRVSAELGRAKMPLSAAVGLPGGTIVELDRAHDEPLDLYVNNRHFGTARLLVVDGEWAVRIETLDGMQAAPQTLADVHEIAPAEPTDEISVKHVQQASSDGQDPPVVADDTE